MPKSGIKIISETPGNGSELKTGDQVRLRYDIQLGSVPPNAALIFDIKYSEIVLATTDEREEAS
jgi:FKBP-type peptidyl-prolyl cis-trans isomerase